MDLSPTIHNPILRDHLQTLILLQNQTLLRFYHDYYSSVQLISHNSKLRKRSFFQSITDSIGQIISPLFGLTSAVDGRALLRVVNELQRKNKAVFTDLGNQITYLGNLTNSIVGFKHKTEHLFQSMLYLESKRTKQLVVDLTQTRLIEIVDNGFSQLQTLMSQISHELDTFRTSIYEIFNQQLPLTLLYSDEFKTAFNQLSTSLFPRSLAPIEKVYHLIKCQAIFDESEHRLISTCSFPIINSSREFTLYKFIPLPTQLYDLRHAYILKPELTTFLFDNETSSFYVPKTATSCHENICVTDSPLTSLSVPCTADILHGVNTSHTCEKRILISPPPFSRPLAAGKYIYFYPNQTTLDIFCGNKMDNENFHAAHMDLFGNGILSLTMDCFAATPFFKYMGSPKDITLNSTYTLPNIKVFSEQDNFTLHQFVAPPKPASIFGKVSLLDTDLDFSDLKRQHEKLKSAFSHPLIFHSYLRHPFSYLPSLFTVAIFALILFVILFCYFRRQRSTVRFHPTPTFLPERVPTPSPFLEPLKRTNSAIFSM